MRKVRQHAQALCLGQGPLGKRRQHVSVRVIPAWLRSQAITHEIGKLLHAILDCSILRELGLKDLSRLTAAVLGRGAYALLIMERIAGRILRQLIS